VEGVHIGVIGVPGKDTVDSTFGQV
jgi:hypothetical protein